MADSQADAVPKTPIIMKVDGPSDEVENTDNEAIGHSICSPAPRPMSSMFSNPFAPKPSSMSSPGASKSVLRPSQLSQHIHSTTTSKPFSLTPGKLNPFLKASTDDSDDKKVESTNGEMPKFVPLITSSKSPPVVGSATGSTSATVSSATDTQKDKPAVVAASSFVFGQNLQERVVSDPAGTPSATNVSSTSDECKPSSSTPFGSCSASTNGTSSKEEMLFSTAIKEAPVSTSDGGTQNNASSKSLTESAREYEEQRNNKRKYEEVETKTGEEDETNVMQISCKLFAFDKGVGNWQERGRGILRLNDLIVADKENDGFYSQSRLVFRTSGVHKVILNTKIWAEMTVEQPSAKSVRFTAIDTAGEIKVFLVMASSDETKHLHKLVQERRAAEQKRLNLKKLTTDETSPSKNDSTSSLMDTSALPSTPMKESTVDDADAGTQDEDTNTNGRQESVIRSSSLSAESGEI